MAWLVSRHGYEVESGDGDGHEDLAGEGAVWGVEVFDGVRDLEGVGAASQAAK